MFKNDGLKEELSQDLETRVIEHKKRFQRIFYGRYKELLPSLIVYENAEATSIDFLKLEVALRNNYQVVIGQNNKGVLMILGYANGYLSSENPADLFSINRLRKEDITFVIPESDIPETMSEITFSDNCTTGEFVVLRNKTLNYTNDNEVLLHYTVELSEIVLSRYSIAMQAKINTFFMSEVNDESINQIVTALYNGSPYIKVSKLFDPKDQIYNLQNEHMAQNFMELKREYQNKISELNNSMGINSLAVEKSSGVSDTEAKSNTAFTGSIANIFLTSRNNPLSCFNKRFGTNIKAVYNDKVESELSHLFNDMDGDPNANMES